MKTVFQLGFENFVEFGQEEILDRIEMKKYKRITKEFILNVVKVYEGK